jgi:hypothetical protein
VFTLAGSETSVADDAEAATRLLNGGNRELHCAVAGAWRWNDVDNELFAWRVRCTQRCHECSLFNRFAVHQIRAGLGDLELKRNRLRCCRAGNHQRSDSEHQR